MFCLNTNELSKARFNPVRFTPTEFYVGKGLKFVRKRETKMLKLLPSHKRTMSRLLRPCLTAYISMVPPSEPYKVSFLV